VQLTQSFLRFVDKANAAGKGVLKINYIGGPEITNAPEQPTALRNGLFEILYGPAAYYLGMLPDADFLQVARKTTPPVARTNGAYDQLREAMKAKMDARLVGWFDSGLGLHIFLANEPKRTASGGIDLTGLKLRSSPSYRDFIAGLGGTPVVLSDADVYTALERGTVDGMGFSLTDVRDRKLERFVKYRIDPPMSYAGILMIMNQKKWDAMPQNARAILDKAAAEWEIESRKFWEVAQDKEKELLAKSGMKTITLTGAAGEQFEQLYRNSVIKRIRSNDKITVNVDKLLPLMN
jgi:TRAP-type C4-dicarboxylate transport system substrate-binding protein